MKAEIIAIGSEMLTPFRVDTNSLFLTDELNKLGIEVARKSVVGDDRADLRDVFSRALERADIVIAIGGLGPTEDDLTREVLSDLLRRKLNRNEEVLRGIQERFRRFGRQMPETNIRQAMVPEGATVLGNTRGTAPGLWLEEGGKILILLPGPPQEMKGVFLDQAQAMLERLAPRGVRLHSRELRIVMMPESEVDHRAAPIYTTYTEVQTTILAVPGEIQLHYRYWTADTEKAEKTLNEMVERTVFVLGEAVYTTKGEALEEVVANALNENGATIAVAESCTGGLLAERLTRIPGSSSYFRGGVVCYSNDIKSAWVDVPAELIEAKGPVSAEVAVALAEGIRRRSGATLGIGVTGVAGPGGGSAEKPVGTAHIALANGATTKERAFRFPGDRERVRFQASQAGLDMVRRFFLYAKT
jgi:nicotinamide-nucleotide amidase